MIGITNGNQVDVQPILTLALAQLGVNTSTLVGPKGDRGDRGIPGIEGPSGAQGIQGPIGEQGVQGPEENKEFLVFKVHREFQRFLQIRIVKHLQFLL